MWHRSSSSRSHPASPFHGLNGAGPHEIDRREGGSTDRPPRPPTIQPRRRTRPTETPRRGLPQAGSTATAADWAAERKGPLPRRPPGGHRQRASLHRARTDPDPRRPRPAGLHLGRPDHRRENLPTRQRRRRRATHRPRRRRRPHRPQRARLRQLRAQEACSVFEGSGRPPASGSRPGRSRRWMDARPSWQGPKGDRRERGRPEIGRRAPSPAGSPMEDER